MSKKTITKILSFVICATLAGGLSSACSFVQTSDGKKYKRTPKDVSPDYESPKTVGTIASSEITESSGLAASKCQAGIFWTHNDSGDDAFVFALNARGENLGTYKVAGAKNRDWEDIAEFKNPNGECFLYIGDIGDNNRAKKELTIYLVREPTVSPEDKTSSRKNPQMTEPARAVRVEYPDAPHDAETLLVHPQTGDVYVLSKNMDAPSGVYKLAANYDLTKTNRLEKIADVTVPNVPNGLLTGGDISSDGKRIVLCDYSAAYEIVLPQAAKNFDEIWREKPLTIVLSEREQGEAVCYSANGESIYATSEKEDSPVIEVRRK